MIIMIGLLSSMRRKTVKKRLLGLSFAGAHTDRWREAEDSWGSWYAFKRLVEPSACQDYLLSTWFRYIYIFSKSELLLIRNHPKAFIPNTSPPTSHIPSFTNNGFRGPYAYLFSWYRSSSSIYHIVPKLTHDRGHHNIPPTNPSQARLSGQGVGNTQAINNDTFGGRSSNISWISVLILDPSDSRCTNLDMIEILPIVGGKPSPAGDIVGLDYGAFWRDGTRDGRRDDRRDNRGISPILQVYSHLLISLVIYTQLELFGSQRKKFITIQKVN